MSEQAFSVQNTSYTLPLQLANAAAGVLDFLGLPLGYLDQQSILKSAARSEGSDNFGAQDFMEPMSVALEACQEQPLTPLARVVVRQAMIAACRNRIKIERYIEAHPEVEDIEIERPVFVLGFPRTGTTALQNMLALDEELKALQFWELLTPVPTSDDRQADRKKRTKVANQVISASYIVAPEQSEVHEIKATTYEECWPLFSNNFAVLNYDLQSGFDRFGAWILDHDMRGPYREYKRTLQIIAHYTGKKQFILKCPEHLWFLDALLDVFPDACIVWTHRDPVASVASYSSLISMQWRTLFGKFDPLDLGTHVEGRFLTGVQRAMAARDASGKDDQFFDVDFAQFVKDQPGWVAKIKDHFGLPHDEASDRRVQEWLESDRKDHRGAHRYSAERYGIDTDKVHADFADYIQRFDIPLKKG